MKKYFKLFFIALCAVVFTATPASAEEFFASDLTGAVMQDNNVTVNENEAQIVYEWYMETSGRYNVSFNDAESTDCTITASFNDGCDIKIADITKTMELGLDAGINKISLNVIKNSSSSTFSIGTVKISYIGELNASPIHIEANNEAYTYATSGFDYIENYGTDMSNGDIMRTQVAPMPEISFAVYAPVSGEYTMSIVMSDLGQVYTSDVNMTVNGISYPLTLAAMKHSGNLTNASDPGLMKRFKKKNTVTLKQGINSIVFSAIEKRENYKDVYLFYLDCVDFEYVNEIIEIEANAEEPGEYKYSVFPAYSSQYVTEVTITSQEALHNLPNCSVSADGVNYIRLIKGKTVEVVSEYSMDGCLYGTYRLVDNISVTDTICLRLDSGECKVEKISLMPVINGVKEIFARAEKVILTPFKQTDISVFAVDKEGYALNLDYLRKKGGVSFKSSNRNILAVDADGRVVALKPGIACIIVAASDGDNEKVCDVSFNVYNESYGFTVLSAEKDEDYVKVRLLSPFGAKEEEHTMIMAEFTDDTLINVHSHTVNALGKGQIVTYKIPATENVFKIISLNTFTTMQPVYEVVTVKE